MSNELPDDFELIVIGTGMVESIIAAAASRVGKKVLHIDSNDYYGGMWASFNLEGLEKCLLNPKVSSKFTVANKDEFLKDGEQFLDIDNDLFGIKNAVQKWHVKIEEKKEITIEQEIESSGEITDAKAGGEPAIEEKNIEIQPKLTQELILKESRKFNLDIAPKLQFARGDFVELLISSNIARYSEYRSVSRVLTWLNGHLEVVPCSRSDVFSNTRVTVVEKRMLMKLLTSCMDDDLTQFNDYVNKTFYDYLKDKKLTKNLIHYVLYAISMSDKNTLCLDGVANTKRFLNSLGRFGKTPFLFSMYGSGELPQAFCRLCAVFGGIYCLNRPINTIILDKDNKFSAIICDKQKIQAENVVMSIEKVPKQFTTNWKTQQISRAIFITDNSILPCEKENLTLLLFPPEDGKNAITVIELGPVTGTCPQNFYIIHMYCMQGSNPKEDFENCVNNLFNINEEDKTELILPKILWSVYFTLKGTENNIDTTGLPKNMYACPGPDLDLDFDESVKKAKEIFNKIYPDEEFLPRAPDPEDIILCEDENAENQEKEVVNTEKEDEIINKVENEDNCQESKKEEGSPEKNITSQQF